MPSRLVAVLVAAAALAHPPAAEGPSRVQRDRALAIRLWGPVCGGEEIEIYNQPLGGNYIGWSNWSGDHPPYHDCDIRLSSTIHWPSPKLCTVLLHEYRHLAGYRARHPYHWTDRHGVRHTDPLHSANPDSLMYPRYLRPFWRCTRLGKRGLERRSRPPFRGPRARRRTTRPA